MCTIPGSLALTLALLLALLLTPRLTVAQPPAAWSVAASTCTPDEDSLALYSTDQARLSFRPGAYTPFPRTAQNPLLVRCPIPPPSDTPQWRVLEPVWLDPDGDAFGSRLEVRLKRHAPGRRAEAIAVLSSHQRPPVAYITEPWDFATYVYWIELSLWRRSPTTPTPVAFEVWLKTLDSP